MSNLESLRDAVSSGDRVLDVGSKTGDDMATVDASTIAIDIAFKSTEADTEYALADGTRLPFRDGVFDYVYCNHVLEHVEDKRALLAEIRRVLTTGGEALFAFPNRLSPHAPHRTPGWYSFLPRPVGLWLAPTLLDGDVAEYYRTSEFMLSPLRARYLLHRTFDDVQYRVFENKVAYGGSTQRTGLDGAVQAAINRHAELLASVVDVPVVGHLVELWYPPVAYRCRVA